MPLTQPKLQPSERQLHNFNR